MDALSARMCSVCAYCVRVLHTCTCCLRGHVLWACMYCSLFAPYCFTDFSKKKFVYDRKFLVDLSDSPSFPPSWRPSDLPVNPDVTCEIHDNNVSCNLYLDASKHIRMFIQFHKKGKQMKSVIVDHLFPSAPCPKEEKLGKSMVADYAVHTNEEKESLDTICVQSNYTQDREQDESCVNSKEIFEINEKMNEDEKKIRDGKFIFIYFDIFLIILNVVRECSYSC